MDRYIGISLSSPKHIKKNRRGKFFLGFFDFVKSFIFILLVMKNTYKDFDKIF